MRACACETVLDHITSTATQIFMFPTGRRTDRRTAAFFYACSWKFTSSELWEWLEKLAAVLFV